MNNVLKSIIVLLERGYIDKQNEVTTVNTELLIAHDVWRKLVMDVHYTGYC